MKLQSCYQFDMAQLKINIQSFWDLKILMPLIYNKNIKVFNI